MGLRVKSEKNEDEYTRKFLHSGLNYSRRRKFVVVENNAISDEALALTDRPSNRSSRSSHFKQRGGMS